MRPLIDNNQTFDIALSVWIRATEEYEQAHRKRKDLKAIDGGTRMDNSQPQGDDEDILETPLFSDIVFRGLSLKNKGVSAKVQFRLPTARLCVLALVSVYF